MRRIRTLALIIAFVFLSNIIHNAQSVSIEKIDLKLRDEEVAIVFIPEKDDGIFLIVGESKKILLVLDYKSNNIKKVLRKFNANDVTLVMLKDFDLDIEYKGKVILSNTYHEDHISYTLDDNAIKIEYEDVTFCINVNRPSVHKNLMDCNFIYFYSIKDIASLQLNDKTDVVFYHYRRPLSTYFMEEIYEYWISTYMIRENEYTILKIAEDYYNIIVIPNI